MATAQPIHKHVLYYAGHRGLSAGLFHDPREVEGRCVGDAGDGAVVSCGNVDLDLVVRHDVQSALDALHRDFFNLVVLDLREPVHGRPGRSTDFATGLALLDAMDQDPDIERRYGFHRIVVIVSSHDAAEIGRRITVLGARGVGRVMRDPSECELHEGCRWLPSKAEAARAVLDEMMRLVLHRQVGKLALCASGGGITGLYFELGALRCLEDCCSPGALNACDLYFGISSGGVVVAMLANGYTVSEFMAAIAGVEGGRIPPLDFNLLDASHLDLGGLTAPLWQFLYDAQHPQASKDAALKNHLMRRSTYNALVSGDGACAGCGEKTVLHAIASVTEAYMRPIYHAKAARLAEKAGRLKDGGVERLSTLAARHPEGYARLRKAVEHLVLGLGGRTNATPTPGSPRTPPRTGRSRTARSSPRSWPCCGGRRSTTASCKPSTGGWPTACP